MRQQWGTEPSSAELIKMTWFVFFFPKIKIKLTVCGQARKAKVSNFDVAVSANKHVLRLKVSVDDVSFMQVLDGQQYLRWIELGDLLVEVALTHQVLEEFSTLHVLHH